MFDEVEFQELESLYKEGLLKAKNARRVEESSLASINRKAFQPLLKWHKHYTGTDCSIEEVRHHRASLYGPACIVCGKPLRTPRAKRCAECGASASS